MKHENLLFDNSSGSWLNNGNRQNIPTALNSRYNTADFEDSLKRNGVCKIMVSVWYPSMKTHIDE